MKTEDEFLEALKILNLYAGIGGNRELWEGHEVTAVEIDREIAGVYRDRFHDDTVLVGDAHWYLLNHFDQYDFIWSSPPCQSHGQYRHNVGVRAKGYKPLYPDMKLYEEIILLKHHHKGLWVVENTSPYYDPLIPPTARLGRHLLWANFEIDHFDAKASGIRSKNKIADFDGSSEVARSKISNKRQVLRNAVDPELGNHVLMCAIRDLWPNGRFS